jgi:hypothetical protein
VGDRGYAVQCARNVTDFVSSRGYGKVRAEKLLNDPSTKEFFGIFKFLVAQLDPQLEIEGAIEQAVPQIMRRLKYPVEVNRSKLQAISGPNTWPQLLAVLDWLVALIHIHDTLIHPVATCQLGVGENGELEREDGDHLVLRSMHENYVQYLDGKDGHAEDERLRQIYQERIVVLKGEVEHLLEQQVSVGGQLQELHAEHDRLMELQTAPAELEVEAERLRAVIQAAEAHALRMEADIVTAEGERQDELRQSEELESAVRQLREQVDSQPYSRKDIERLKCERSHLRKMVEDLRVDEEKVEQDVFDLTMKDSSRVEAISRLVRGVNDTAEIVELSIGGDAASAQREFTVSVDLLDEPADVLVDVDFKGQRQQACALAGAYSENRRRLEASIQEVVAGQRAMQQESQERERACQLMRTRLEQLELINDECRTWSAEQLDDAQRSAERSEDNFAQASMGSAGPSLRDIADVDDLRLTLSAMRTQGAQERAQMKARVQRAKEQALEHRRSVSKELQTFASQMESLCKTVEEELVDRPKTDDDDEEGQRVAGVAADAASYPSKTALQADDAHGGGYPVRVGGC